MEQIKKIPWREHRAIMKKLKKLRKNEVKTIKLLMEVYEKVKPVPSL